MNPSRTPKRLIEALDVTHVSLNRDGTLGIGGVVRKSRPIEGPADPTPAKLPGSPSSGTAPSE